MIRNILQLAKPDPAAEGAAAPPLSVDEWTRAGGKAEFTCPEYNNPARWQKCSLMARFEGSTVFADEMGPTTGDAFLQAVAKIERTIGAGWRALA